MPNLQSIYDVPQSLSFEGDEPGRLDLQRTLDLMYRVTRAAPPGSARDIRLDPRTRRTQAGARYVSSALFRVCRVLAPGLSSTLVSLTGPEQADTDARERFSTATACQVFNQIVDLRFSGLLSQSQLIVDENRNTIEGLLGPKTHYFENTAFLELVEGLVQSTCEAQFAGATLVGRRLFVRYLIPEPVVTVMGAYRRGYAFCATEAGDDAIRGYLMYQRQDCGSCCLEAPRSGALRQRRTGTKFLDKIKRLLARLLTAEHRPFDRSVGDLLSRPVFRTVDERSIVRTLAFWRRRFKLAGMPADIATNIVTRLLGREGSKEDSGPVVSLSELAEITEYDMFLIAMDESRRRGQRLRELSERATFSVFFGDDT